MHIAIIDDSRAEQQMISKAVTQWAHNSHQSVEFSVFDSGENFSAAVTENHFDIVFMDIYMGGMNGIETAAVLRKHSLDTLLIFLTTSADHMAQAFPCHAFDYIMKPVDISRLYKTLDEALRILPENQPYIDIVFERQKISVLYSDILYILSDSNYCIITVRDNEYRVRVSFNELTSELKNSSEFFIINRGIMVNLDNVLRVDNFDCITVNQKSIPISRRKKDEFEHSLLSRRFEKRRKEGL
ncbi:MAG: LytR/AlgR family response regulator transcription factor [Ruminococcus sp.]